MGSRMAERGAEPRAGSVKSGRRSSMPSGMLLMSNGVTRYAHPESKRSDVAMAEVNAEMINLSA